MDLRVKNKIEEFCLRTLKLNLIQLHAQTKALHDFPLFNFTPVKQ